MSSGRNFLWYEKLWLVSIFWAVLFLCISYPPYSRTLLADPVRREIPTMSFATNGSLPINMYIKRPSTTEIIRIQSSSQCPNNNDISGFKLLLNKLNYCELDIYRKDDLLLEDCGFKETISLRGSNNRYYGDAGALAIYGDNNTYCGTVYRELWIFGKNAKVYLVDKE